MREKKLKITPVQIAVVGRSGSGKSSFNNTIRGIEDGKFSKVSVFETTMEKKSFPFPDNELITLWDLPGAGTCKFPAEEYAEKMEFSTYDAFVILFCDRFTDIDRMIVDEVRKIKKPFFFARTKMDNTIRDEKLTKKNFDASRTLDRIRKDCQKQLGLEEELGWVGVDCGSKMHSTPSEDRSLDSDHHAWT